MEDTNTINTNYFEHDMDEVAVLPVQQQEPDDADAEMAQQLGY